MLLEHEPTGEYFPSSYKFLTNYSLIQDSCWVRTKIINFRSCLSTSQSHPRLNRELAVVSWPSAKKHNAVHEYLENSLCNFNDWSRGLNKCSLITLAYNELLLGNNFNETQTLRTHASKYVIFRVKKVNHVEWKILQPWQHQYTDRRI